MDLERFLKMYQNVSREEMEKIQQTRFQPAFLEVRVEDLNRRREIEKIKGREHVRAGPLIQVLSNRVLPNKVDENKPLAIFGRIYGEVQDHAGNRIIHDLFNRDCGDPEILDPSGILALTGPAETCASEVCTPFHKTRIVVDVRYGAQSAVFAQGSFSVEETTEGDYEQVKVQVVRGSGGSLAVLYVAMPFAVLCCVEVTFSQKKK